ncbi:MAG: hypothetical protein EOP48_08235 [Sphingobacteriales bacterium]|nr:MAG: hypothetical protein EOP48_08235 [Sphingobacteriales bacterium]
MKTFIMTAFAVSCCCIANSRSNPHKQALSNPATIQQRWHIKQLCYASHDAQSTDLDTFNGKADDYVSFRPDGSVHCYFNGVYDTLSYTLLGSDSISFGDTPFRITIATEERLELYQNEQEQNGNYNRVHYILTADVPGKRSNKK